MSDNIENLFDDSIADIDYNKILNEFGIDVETLEKELGVYQPTIDLRFSKETDEVVTPNYAYPSDSGFDLHSTEEIYIEPFGRALVPTGLRLDIPENYEIQVRSKSGLALKQGLMVLNSPGTVDQGYTGEIKVILFNTTNGKIKIEKGQKIAQGVLCPVVSGRWVKIKEVKSVEDKDRSDKGFGSTGI